MIAAATWLPQRRPQPAPRLRLFCFPFAGGGASIYGAWQGLLGAGVEVCAVQLPGREQRIGEAPVGSVHAVVDAALAAIEPLLDRPVAIFGHSMGALLGLELARRVEARGRAVARLVVSAARAPQLPRARAAIAGLPDAEFRAEIVALGGTPPEVFACDELAAMVLPILRADFAAIEGYRPADEGALRAPITAIGWRGDAYVDAEAVRAWSRWTSSTFTARHLDGGHFAVRTAPAPLVAALREELAA
jgi:medium-chain acyl-[acyl-carrier-protein] hydrolase